MNFQEFTKSPPQTLKVRVRHLKESFVINFQYMRRCRYERFRIILLNTGNKVKSN